ncbi:MAG: hydrogenase maturation protein HypF, partial [Saprospiraceae bacterium]
QTSSMGRLFDAVASILGLMDKQTFEGEAAMKLEMSASQYVKKLGIESIKEYYQTNFTNDVLSSNELIRHVIVDLLKDLGIGRIAAKFHLTLVKWIEAIATVQGCKKIAFSGGVFQNSLLVDLTIENLGCEFDLYFHEQLSPNDENISFGQLIYHQIVNNQVKKG